MSEKMWFLRGGGEWWRQKIVADIDICRRVVGTLLFWWEKPQKIKVLERKKYYENRHFRVVFLF